jgi:hypothetical protein
VRLDRNLINAAGYDKYIQEVVVKERLQSRYHWSLDRRFNSLCVMGLQLPGSYFHPAVNTQEKIFAKVRSLSFRMLSETLPKLPQLLEEGQISTTKEHGEEYLKMSLSMVPTTTPPKCVMDLLKIVQEEIDEIRKDISLSKA